MLRILDEMEGYVLQAKDGAIGRCKDFLFEDQPVSRQYEAALFEHLGHLPYWGERSIWGMSTVPSALRASGASDAQAVALSVEPKGDPNLRSLNEVTGYHIHAVDGEIGHVETMVIDDEDWTIRYLVVDTKNWLPGRKVIVPPLWVDSFDWPSATAKVGLTRKKIENSPPFDPAAPVNRSYETRLYDYYGRPSYWK